MSHFQKNILSILLTTECNLACTYCITTSNRFEPFEIDINFAKAGVDYFLANSQSRWIRFYAIGKPTVAFEKMVEITEYARSKVGPALVVEVQTNGTFNAAAMCIGPESIPMKRKA